MTVSGSWLCFVTAYLEQKQLLIELLAVDWQAKRVVRVPIELKSIYNANLRFGL